MLLIIPNDSTRRKEKKGKGMKVIKVLMIQHPAFLSILKAKECCKLQFFFILHRGTHLVGGKDSCTLPSFVAANYHPTQKKDN